MLKTLPVLWAVRIVISIMQSTAGYAKEKLCYQNPIGKK